MNSLKCLLLLSACIGLALGDGFAFSSNFSLSVIDDNDWQFHAIETSVIPTLGWLGANYASVDASESGNSGSADGVFGSANVWFTSFPLSFLSYFKGSFNFDGNTANANFSAVAGYVGTAYLRLEETTPNGTFVTARSLAWSFEFPYTQTDQSSATSQLKYVTYTGKSGDGLQVQFTFLVSSVAGIVNGSIPIVPKSLESVITISNYPYKSTQNTLSLVIAIGTGGASVAASGRSIYSQDKSVYFSLSDSAIVSGSKKGVTISAFSAGDINKDVGNADFAAQLAARYGAAASLKIVKVSFPAGASHIMYDPSVGAGKSAQETPQGQSSSSSATTTIACAALVVLAAAFAL